MKIERSIALVTGANRGLGKALVSALLEAGAAKVYAAARDPRKLVADDPRVVPLPLDTTKAQQIAAAAKTAKDVTLLINNAGVQTSYNVLAARRDELDTDFDTNVHGTLSVIKAFLPVLERAPKGAAIVNVLSIASLASVPAFGGYSASKAAAYSITQALRPTLKALKIEIAAALPGPIDTDMVKDMPLPKTNPADVANGVLAGIERGEEDIFPDAMAQQMGSVWIKSPKELEHTFANAFASL
jgi:NAD(P)-dependent dehydrogenase (short-subunit alcohol dehydrogenase family)